MAFVVKLLFVTALAYGTNAGFLSAPHPSHHHDSHHDHHDHYDHHGHHGHHGGDSFLSSALNSPSASFGPPSQTYGAPSQVHHHVHETLIEDHGPVSSDASLPGVGGLAGASILHGSNIAGPIGHHIAHSHGPVETVHHGIIGSAPGPIASGPGPIIGGPHIASGPGPLLSGPGQYAPGHYAPAHGHFVSGPGPIAGSGLPAVDLSAPAPSGVVHSEGSLILDSTLPAANGQAIGSSALGPARVIGTTVSVGRPDASATRYELQSVVQNVVRRVPVEVTRHVQVSVPQPVPVPYRQEVRVPVPQPYPVHVDVVKHVPYPVYKTEHVSVERPYPVEVVKEVPVEVIKKVHVPVDRPYEVIRKVHVPIEKHVEVPVAVWKPYPLHIIKHITHYKKKSCCW